MPKLVDVIIVNGGHLAKTTGFYMFFRGGETAEGGRRRTTQDDAGRRRHVKLIGSELLPVGMRIYMGESNGERGGPPGREGGGHRGGGVVGVASVDTVGWWIDGGHDLDARLLPAPPPPLPPPHPTSFPPPAL